VNLETGLRKAKLFKGKKYRKSIKINIKTELEEYTKSMNNRG